MIKSGKLAGALLAGMMVLTVPGAAVAQQDHGVVHQEVQDRIDIEQLMWTYVRAADTLNADAYAAVFTPDGAFNKVTGTEALRKMITDMKNGQAERRAKGEKVPPMYHFMANQTIEFLDRDRALVHYYWQTVFAEPVLNPPPRLAAAGRGRDEVVRVNGKWLIKSRNVAPTD
jgi:hypothetical protein